MAKETIDELAISIGLDLRDLELDFDAAGKTVKQAISRINSENKQVKLKADISEIQAAGDAVKKEAIERASLTRQIELQTQKLKLLRMNEQAASQKYGADSGITRSASTAVLTQEKQVAKLQAALAALGPAAMAASAPTGRLFRGISEGSSKAQAGLKKIEGGYLAISGKMAGLMALGMTGAGLFSITDSAMQAGESLYKLSNRLHNSTGEAAQLSRVFAVTGTDIQSIAPFFARLDKQVAAAGATGNATTKAMAQFGFTLTDANGKLLPINQQLAQLAKGYEKAAEAGQEEAFTAQVLGSRGAGLITILQNYNDAMQIASQVKTTGLLNPEEAHKAYMEWKVMTLEAGQLKSALGAALLPVAKDLMPEVTEGFRTLIEYIKANKDDIKNSIESWSQALLSVAKAAGSAAEAIGKIMGGNKTTSDFEKYNPGAASTRKWLTGVGMLAGGGIGGFLGGPGGAMVGAGLGAGAENALVSQYEKYLASQNSTFREYQNRMAHAEQYASDGVLHGKYSFDAFKPKVAGMDAVKQDLLGLSDAQKKLSETLQKSTSSEKENEKAADKNAAAQQKAAEAAKYRTTAMGQLQEQIYKLTHTDLENSERELALAEEKYRGQGIDEDTIAKFHSASMDKILKDYRRNVSEPMAEAFKTDLQKSLDAIDTQAEDFLQKGASQGDVEAWKNKRKQQITADWDRQVAEQIDSVWQSEYQNQLARINREKQAWIQKGLDEVKATQWAEERKRQLQQQAVKEMFTSQKKYLEIYRNAMMRGMDQHGAAQAIAAQMRKANGISDTAFTSPGEIAGFQAAMREAQQNLVPILSDATYKGVKQAMVEVMRGNQTSFELPDEAREQYGIGAPPQASIAVDRGTQSGFDAIPTSFTQDILSKVSQQTDGVQQLVSLQSNASTQLQSQLGQLAQLCAAPAGGNGQAAPMQNVTYHLVVSITGLEDVSNVVAQTAAKKILSMLPSPGSTDLRYAMA